MERIPICKPIINEEMIEAAADALRNEPPVNGESVFKFEEEFADYIGVEHAVSTSSGTDALILSLMACGLKGRDVVTTPFTFIASCNSIVHVGARPVLADIRDEDCNLDPVEIKKRISEGTKAVMPVHIFGRPCAMDEIMDLAQDNELLVIEDACQAHGAAFGAKKVGSIGDVGCFSFYPTKNMTVGGDGGMVTTDDESIAMMVRKLRDCGRKERYLHDVHGFTSRMNTVNAAIGRVQLRKLDAWNESRRKAADYYHSALKDIDGLKLPPHDDKAVSVHHLFAVRCGIRDALKSHLHNEGIDTAIHYPIPVHLQPAFEGRFEERYPISEKASETTISLPMYPTLNDEELKRVCECVTGFFSEG